MAKAGFISFIGRPNVGKSTLMNMFVGEKVAIMSPKAQTTRTLIQAVKTSDKGQIIILDTPGVHKPQDALGEFMNEITSTVNEGVDVVALLLPANDKIGTGDTFILNTIIALKEQTPSLKVLAIVTKIDIATDAQIMAKLQEVSEFYDFDAIIPVSGKKKNNLEVLEDVILDLLPESPLLFPEDEVHQIGDRFMIQELVREKILHVTEEEIPHAVAVQVEKIVENEKEFEIDAVIIVERKSQKGIIIGKQGSKIREIRIQAERDLKRHFGKKCVLQLWVKVEENWRSKNTILHKYGYDITDYE